MTLLECLKLSNARLSRAGIVSPLAESRLLLQWACSLAGAEFWAALREKARPRCLRRLEEALERRIKGEPLQLITGRTNFYGLELAVSAGVLIPRPETEMLVELALSELQNLPAGGRIFDAGCGGGAIALAIKKVRPDLEVWAGDPDPAALDLCRHNARELGLDVTVVAGAYLAGLENLDAVVSNPPYLPDDYRKSAPPELAWESDSALYAGKDGLAVALPLAREASSSLNSGGLLLLELDPGNVDIFAQQAQRLGFQSVKINEDLARRRRFVIARKG